MSTLASEEVFKGVSWCVSCLYLAAAAALLHLRECLQIVRALNHRCVIVTKQGQSAGCRHSSLGVSINSRGFSGVALQRRWTFEVTIIFCKSFSNPVAQEMPVVVIGA